LPVRPLAALLTEIVRPFHTSGKRTCPHCGAQVAPIRFKVTAEKLDIDQAKYIVRQTQVETCACPHYHYLCHGRGTQRTRRLDAAMIGRSRPRQRTRLSASKVTPPRPDPPRYVAGSEPLAPLDPRKLLGLSTRQQPEQHPSKQIPDATS
jgi:zinc-finger binding domain of transposase IS66